MKRFFLLAPILALSLSAAARDFTQPCSTVYPAAVGAMTSAQFEPTVSDAAGGVLAMKFTGQPMVYNFMVSHAAPYLAKYVGQSKKYRGLTFTTANFLFKPGENGGCQVDLKIGLAALDQKADSATRSHEARWVRTATPVASNGTAENEFLDRIAGK
jgi:hypothetical protein